MEQARGVLAALKGDVGKALPAVKSESLDVGEGDGSQANGGEFLSVFRRNAPGDEFFFTFVEEPVGSLWVIAVLLGNMPRLVKKNWSGMFYLWIRCCPTLYKPSIGIRTVSSVEMNAGGTLYFFQA